MSTRRVTVFGSSRIGPEDRVYADAVRLGRLLVQAGFTLCSGGYSGVMEAVSRGAVEAGGRAIGVTVAPWRARLQPNPWITEEVPAPDLFQRISRMIASDAYVAMPGGLGTLGEVALTWNLFQTNSIPHRPFVLVGRPWRDLFESLPAAVRIEPRDLELVRFVDAVEDVVPAIQAGIRDPRMLPNDPDVRRPGAPGEFASS